MNKAFSKILQIWRSNVPPNLELAKTLKICFMKNDQTIGWFTIWNSTKYSVSIVNRPKRRITVRVFLDFRHCTTTTTDLLKIIVMLVRFLYTANTTYLKNEIMLYVRAMLYFLAIWTFYLDLGKLFQKSSMIWPP